jgi:hypothetical protein
MVIAPARTGSDKRSRTAVIRTDQTNSGMESKDIEADRMFMMVVMKLIAPRIEEAPARCNLKIARSTEIPE